MPETIFVGRLMPGDPQTRKPPQRSYREVEGGGRDIDKRHTEVGERSHQRLDQQRELLPVSATELDQRDRRGQPGADRGRVHREQAPLGAGDAVLGQLADRFEKLRAKRVIQIPGLKLLLGTAQTPPDVFGETVTTRQRVPAGWLHIFTAPCKARRP